LTNSTLGSELAINITDGKLFYKDNANAVQVIGWKTVPTTAGGTGLTTYTAGDLSYYASGTTFTKLAIGTIGQILTSTGSAPQWTTLSGVAVTTFSAGTTGFTPNSATSGAVTLAGTLVVSNGGTGLTTLTAGYIPYGNGTSAFGSSSNLFWNSSTSCLGIGLVNGTSKLEVLGAGGNNGGANATYEGTIKINEAGAFDLQTTGGLEFKGSVFGSGYGSKIFSTDAGVMLFGVRQNSATWTETMRLTGAGDVSVTNGNVVMATSGKGIDFSATPGTGTSELLADYEEGTWTPTVTPATGSFTSVTDASGVYTKVGNIVTLCGRFTLANSGTGAGLMTISNLPYANASGWASSTQFGRRINDGVIQVGQLASGQIQSFGLLAGTTGIVNGNLYVFNATYAV
jgi:hypothetical protein